MNWIHEGKRATAERDKESKSRKNSRSRSMRSGRMGE